MAEDGRQMIIDVHGHYTTAPAELEAFRGAQLAARGALGGPARPVISDEQLRASVAGNQLRIMRERGEDVMIFSPKAAGMEHHVPYADVAIVWAQESNNLVHRISELFPGHFAPVAQLPQTPEGNIAAVVAEIRRTVGELGFVGVNLNPDPSGTWAGLPLTDVSWYPVYEALEELDTPAMIHVSAARNPNFHTLGAHYLNADTSVFVQLLQSDLFHRFPGLRLVIPHGGGAVPYHWGRFRGLSARNGWQDPSALLTNVYFDTAVYHQPGIDLLVEVIPADNVLFASEMLGAVRGADPETGVEWDDTLRYLAATTLSDVERTKVLCDNALRVYPRLSKWVQRG